jgi:hypothetical protein
MTRATVSPKCSRIYRQSIYLASADGGRAPRALHASLADHLVNGALHENPVIASSMIAVNFHPHAYPSFSKSNISRVAKWRATQAVAEFLASRALALYTT